MKTMGELIDLISMIDRDNPRYAVGGHMWIREEDFIGYAPNAIHGHGLPESGSTPGSINDDCIVEVLEEQENRFIVYLHRKEMPYGAPAPIGTVFYLDKGMIGVWKQELIEKQKIADEKKSILERLFK